MHEHDHRQQQQQRQQLGGHEGLIRDESRPTSTAAITSSSASSRRGRLTSAATA